MGNSLEKWLLSAAIAVPCFAQPPLVKGVGNFIHNVADLDQSVHFYKDILGMDMPRPASGWQTTDAVLKLYGAVGGKFRTATAQVPGVTMRVELAEFAGVERKPVRRSLGEPGASLLILTVANLQPVLDRMKAANWPLAVEGTGGCDGSGFAVADPDGFQILVLHENGIAAGAMGFTDLQFGYTVSSDAVLNGPFKALRLAGQPLPAACGSAVDRFGNMEQAILNTGDLTKVKLPDGFQITLVPSARGKRSAGTARPQDPGAAVLRLTVPDAEAAVQALATAGVKVVSEGGATQTLSPGGAKAAILGAPDNLFIQVVQ
jgi:catechol 2,3-dioxygenase-like lactoylglutathione lyase family enzyme